MASPCEYDAGFFTLPALAPHDNDAERNIRESNRECSVR